MPIPNIPNMPLMEHLDELRSRLTRSVSVVMVAFLLLLFKAQDLINFLKAPLVAALPVGTPALHFTGPMDVMFVGMKVAFMAAVIITSPFWLREFWKFFEPGLYQAERKYILPFILGSVVLFLSGIAFCFFVALPYTLGFLITIGMEVGVPIITVTDYIGLLILMFAGFGLVFETPLILVLLSLLGIVDSAALKAHRRIAFVVILIVAAILTPGPDPISQFVMAVPLFTLFELSILIISHLEKKRATSSSQAPSSQAPSSSGSTTALMLTICAATFAALNPAKLIAEPASSWAIGTGLSSYHLDSESIHALSGQSIRISLGHVTTGANWSLAATMDMLLGPYKPMNPGNLRRIDVDFNGTGITAIGSYHLRNFSDEKSVGSGFPALLAGMSYVDLTGRSLGGGYEQDFVLSPVVENKSAETPVTALDNYKLRTTRFSAIAGIGWSANWAKPPKSNDPMDLKTKVNGYNLSFWAEIPIISRYAAEYDLVTATDHVESQKINSHGTLGGFSLVAQASAFLGG